MNIFTRVANISDSASLEMLAKESYSSYDLFRGGDRLVKELNLPTPSMKDLFNEKDLNVFVAGSDQIVLGFLVARTKQIDKGLIATIERVFVTKETRNLGIGDALVTFTKSWAKQQGFIALDGFALPGDRETKNLFERAGLVARLITVTSDLQD